jgi:hypothetical protein
MLGNRRHNMLMRQLCDDCGGGQLGSRRRVDEGELRPVAAVAAVGAVADGAETLPSSLGPLPGFFLGFPDPLIFENRPILSGKLVHYVMGTYIDSSL